MLARHLPGKRYKFIGKSNILLEWDFNDPDIVMLVAKSDEYLNSLYSPESNHAEPLEALLLDAAPT